MFVTFYDAIDEYDEPTKDEITLTFKGSVIVESLYIMAEEPGQVWIHTNIDNIRTSKTISIKKKEYLARQDGDFWVTYPPLPPLSFFRAKFEEGS
jgi:hypothetical protein